MDILNSVFTICSTVSETDREYRILAKKLQYELQKALHLMKTQKIKSIPQFIVINLKKSIEQGKKYLEKIQKLLHQDSIPLKEKIKLSLPFNKTNQEVKLALEQLQKAQQDVSSYECQSEPENNNSGKRYILMNEEKTYLPNKKINQYSNNNNFDKKDETREGFSSKQEEQQQQEQIIMGPTIQQDAQVGFAKNKYIKLNIQLKGECQIIETIKKIDSSILSYKQKIQIKFDEDKNQHIQDMELFSLGRVYFKPVYSKLRVIYPDIDRISKNNHFIVKLRRKKQVVEKARQYLEVKDKQKKEEHSQQSEKQSNSNNNEKNQSKQKEKDLFFSFPVTTQHILVKQTDLILVQKSTEKNLFFLDPTTGIWKKMQQNQKQLCKGDQIAAFIQINMIPPNPGMYFKINFQILE